MANTFPVLANASGIDAVAYAQAEAYIMEILATRFPDRDFGYGRALYWNVVVPAAVASAVVQTNADLQGNSMSLKWIRDNPDLVTDDLAAGVLSNYYQTIRSGTPSTGTLSIIVSDSAPYSVSEGAQFVANGVTYATTTPIFVHTSAAEVTSDSDRLLTSRSDGSYQFTVPVESTTTGTTTFAPMNTEFTASAPFQGLLRVLAATDISGGTDDQSVKDVAATIPTVFAAQTFGSKIHVSAMIAEAFPGTKVASIGMGDPEQSRDTHNPLAIQTGGMVDLYVATQASMASEVVPKDAVLIDAVDRIWETQFTREESSGYYTVTKVVPTGSTASGMPIADIDRTISIPTTGYQPIITTPAEAAFSAYQALRVRFQDIYQAHSGLSPGATRSYDFEVQKMPLVQEISDYMNAGRLSGVDNVLVRGAVPCVTKVTLEIRLLDSDSLTDAEITAMKQAIVNRIGIIGFGYGVLSSSIIVDAVHDYISGRSDISANSVSLRGDIVAPTGESLFIEGQEIRIPEDPTRKVTKNTTVFLTNASLIDISVIPVGSP